MPSSRITENTSIQGIVTNINNVIDNEYLGTTTNVGSAYSLTYDGTVEINRKFLVKFNAESLSAPTLSINSGSAYPIVFSNGNSAKIYAAPYELFFDGSKYVQIGASREVVNNLTESVANKVLDATQGKILSDRLNNVEKLTKSSESLVVTSGIGSWSSNVLEGPPNSVLVRGQSVFQYAKNPYFSEGTTNWSSQNSSGVVTNKVYTNTGSGIAKDPFVSQAVNIPSTINRKVFVRSHIRTLNSLTTDLKNRVYNGNSVWYCGVKSGTEVEVNKWTYVYGIATINTTGNNLRVDIQHYYTDATTSNGNSVEIDEVTVIDMGISSTDNELYNLTEDQMHRRFPTKLNYGLISTLTTKVVVTKNIFNGILESGIYDGNTGYATSNSTYMRNKYIVDVEPNTTYYISNDKGITGWSVYYYDINKKFLSAWSGLTSFTIPVNCYYINFRSYAGTNLNDLTAKVQVEKGTATSWSAFGAGGQVSVPKLSTKFDLYDPISGIKTLGSSSKVFNGTESWSTEVGQYNDTTAFFTLASGITDGVLMKDGSDLICYNFSVTDTDVLYASTYTNEGISKNAAGTIRVRVLKSRLSTIDTTGFKTWLASNQISLYYKLALPTLDNSYNSSSMKAYPNSAILVKPYITDISPVRNGKVSITPTAAKSIEWVTRRDYLNKLEIPVDMSKVTLASDGLSFIVTGSSEEEWYEYGGYPLDELSINSIVTGEASTNISGVVLSNSNYIMELNKDIDKLSDEVDIRLSDVEEETTETLTTYSTGSFSVAAKDSPLRVLTIDGITRNNYIKSSNMNTDSNADGVVNDFTSSTAAGITTSFTLDSAQKIDITASTITGNIDVYQVVDGIYAGDTISFRVDAKATLNGTCKAKLYGVWLDSANNVLSTTPVVTFTNTSYAEVKVINSTAPANTAKIRFVCRVSIDTVGDTGTVWFKNAMLEKASTVGNYITSGIKSTLSSRLKSISQDNLVDNTKMISGSAISATDGSILVSTVHYRTGFIPVIPNTQYILSGMNSSVSSLAGFYDINKNYISRTSGAMYTTLPFTTPTNAYYVIFNQGGYSDQATQQVDFMIRKGMLKLERGTTVTAWKSYADTITYSQDLPTRWDSHNILTGIKTQGGNTKLPSQLTWTKLGTETTNHYLFQTSSMTDMNRVASDNITYIDIYNYNAKLKTTNWTNYAALDDYSFYVDTNNYLSIKIPKADLTGTTNTDVQNWLSSKSIYISYQLAQPIYTKYTKGIMKSYPNGILISEPYIKDKNYIQDGKISILKGAVKSIEWVNKLDLIRKTETPVDMSKVTLASDGLSFTITGYSDKEWYEYGGYPLDGSSTNGLVVATANTSLGSTIVSTSTAVVELSNNLDKTIDEFDAKITNIEKLSESPQEVVTTSSNITSFSSAVIEGPITSAVTNGSTLKQELVYTSSTWSEWVKLAGNTADASGLSFDGTQANPSYLLTTVKPSTKYLILFSIVSTTLSSATNGLYVKLADVVAGGTSYTAIGNQKMVVTTPASITANRITIGTNTSGSGTAKLSSIRVFEIPLGSEIETDTNTLTVDQLAQKYPYVKGGTLVSTTSGRLTITKNVLDTNFYKSTSNGNTTISGNEITSNFTNGALFLNTAKKVIQLEPSKVCTFSVIPITSNTCLSLYVYNSQGVAMNSILLTNINTQSGIPFTVPADGKVALCVGGNYLNPKQCTYKLQVELGTIATDYTPYALGGQAYTQDLATKWDSFNVVTGVKTQGGNNKVIQTSDVTGITQSTTNSYVVVSKPTDAISYGNVISSADSVSLDGFTSAPVNDDGTYYKISCRNTNTQFVITFPLNTTLAQAQAVLVGRTISYQLAVPVPIEYGASSPVSGPGRAVIWEPYIHDADGYGGKISLRKYAAKSIDWVMKFDSNQVFIPVDISKVTLATDGMSFTITGANDGEYYEYGAYPVDGSSTNSIVTVSASTSIGGVVNNLTDSVSNLSSKTDDIMTANNLINQKLSDIELLYWMGV